MFKQIILASLAVAVTSAAAQATPRGMNARGFFVSEAAISTTRTLLQVVRNPFITLSSDEIADDIGAYCELRSMGFSDSMHKKILESSVANASADVAFDVRQYIRATVSVAKVYACEQYR